MGRKTELRRRKAFFLHGDRIGKKMSNPMVSAVKGIKGTQSLKIPRKIFHKEPKSSTKIVLAIGCPL